MALEPLADLRVADLFAGSGALGIEALSRGAAHAHFLEPSRPALAALHANLAALGLTQRSTVWPLRWPEALRRVGSALADCDLVLADPPYRQDYARDVLERLGGQALKPGSRVVLEHHAKVTLPPRAGGLERERERSYGETVITWYRREGRHEPNEQGR